MKTQAELILETLEPLFKEAEKGGLWFRYSSLTGLMLFSPKELKAKHAKGKAIWGPSNWRLADPNKELRRLKQKALKAKQEVEKFEARIEESLK